MFNQNSKINRNALCPCGSGQKYKKCCLNNSQTTFPKIQRQPEYIVGMVLAARLARKTLDFVSQRLQPDISTHQIDQWVSEFLIANQAVSATLNYEGYPKSCCVSINEVICHGIPDSRVLKSGDLVNVDVSCILNGFYGDVSRSFLIGECSAEARKVCAVTLECLNRGMAVCKPYKRIGDIGAAIQEYAEQENCSVVERFVGHGIGKKFHEDLQIPHYGKPNTGELIVPGMFFTIEPMINLGSKHVKILEDGWTAITADKKLSCQFEHTLMITEQGKRIITDEPEGAPLI